MDKKQYCYILYDYKNVNTVELRWLVLEGTAKMCSSHQKFEPPRSHNFREKKISLKIYIRLNKLYTDIDPTVYTRPRISCI
jgi:hypothetical protein